MTIQFIDHALNVILAGLLYGSEAWIVSAFGLYVITHERPLASADLETTVAKNTIKNTVVETVNEVTAKGSCCEECC